jgi:tetratricopeptide (TPR) repeat protein
MNAVEREALEAERDFLLRSIADLDAERAAGDLADADYTALRDDYVARAAEVLRSIDATGSDSAHFVRGSGTSSARRAVVTVVACLLVAAVAGVALAGAVGSRRAGDSLTGSLPTTVSDQLNEASQLIGEGKAVEAIKLYDKILKDDPEQPVALAYRGWIVRLAGLKDEGLSYVDRAVAADPSYPDAHFFRGMMLWEDKSDPAGAVGEFRLFLANRPPQAMVSLVEDALQRAAAEAGIPAE